jgi:hypothetical protein
MHEGKRPSTPATPESVWKSIHEKDEASMDITMTPDQLCARARSRETGNVWAHRISAVLLIVFAGVFAYNAIVIMQPWVRMGQLWMIGVLCFYFLRLVRHSPRRMRANESCARFLEREFEGRRNTLLEARRAIFLLIPAILASWWGGGPALRLKALGVNPDSRHFQFASGPGPFIIIGLVLIFVWFSLGHSAKKASRQIEELHRRTQSE